MYMSKTEAYELYKAFTVGREMVVDLACSGSFQYLGMKH